MSILNGNINIKIKDVATMSWDVSNVNVAARTHHALVFRISGSAVFSNNSSTLSTSVGDVFYMPAGCSYTANYPEHNNIFVIHFYSDSSADMENFHINTPHLISSLFQSAYDVWNKKAEGYYYKTLSIFGEILESIAVQNSSELQGQTKEAFETAVQYMESNYLSSNFTVEKTVSLAYMSNTYFRKLFTEKFGVTPAKYITSKRLLFAEKLLSSGKYSIKEVAEKCGFCDEKYFSRVVKKEYGVPPSKLYCHSSK